MMSEPDMSEELTKKALDRCLKRKGKETIKKKHLVVFAVEFHCTTKKRGRF